MNHEAISQIFFAERYTVTADETANSLFQRLRHGSTYAGELVDAMATSHLLALLESICLREIHRHIDRDVEVVVGNAIDLHHCAPIPGGAEVMIRGWVEGIGERDASFYVQAYDEQEKVCEGTLRLAVVRREEYTRRIERKCETIARREQLLVA
jgi:fluoroacetyl-CoA thioesterase